MKNDASELVTKTYLDKKLSEFDEKARDYRDDVLGKLDEVVRELETMREENLIGSYQIKELRKHDANHERRLRKFEQARNAA